MKPQYIIAAVLLIILVVYFATCNNGSGLDVNDNTSLVDSANANDLAVDTLNLQNLSESEQLQLEMNQMIENEIQASKSSGNVKALNNSPAMSAISVTPFSIILGLATASKPKVLI